MGVARAAIWLAAGRSVWTASNIFLPLVLVRVFTKPEYGIFKQVDLAAALVLPFVLLGFGKSIVYYVPRTKHDRELEVSGPLTMVLIVSACLLVLSAFQPEILGRLLGVAEMRLLTVAAVAGAMSGAVTNATNQALISVDAARSSAIMTATIGTIRAGTLLSLAVFSRSLHALILTLFIFAILETIIALLVLYKHDLLKLGIKRRIIGKHIKFAGPLALVGTVQAWSYRIDRYFVSGVLGPAAFAVYAVGMPNIPFLPHVATSVRDAAAPRYSALEAEGRYKEIADLYRKSLEAVFPVYFLVTCFFVTSAQWIVPVLFTSAYIEAVPVFRIFAITLLVDIFYSIETVLRAMRAIKFLVLSVLASLVLRILLIFAVVSYKSLPLIAVAHLLIGILLVVVLHSYLRSRLKVSWSNLLPLAGLRFTIAMGFIISSVTVLYWVYWCDDRIVGLVVSLTIWGSAIFIALWKQGLWRSIFSLYDRRRL